MVVTEESSGVKVRVIVVSVSLILYAVSLFFTAISYADYDGPGSFSSFELALFGGVAVLGVGLFEWLIWLANPLYFIALIRLLKSRKGAVYIGATSFFFAFIFLTWNEILVAENGRHAAIVSLNAGYYLWLASILTLTIGALLERKIYAAQQMH